MSQYPVPPPSYGSATPSPKQGNLGDESRDPLLGSSASGRAFFDQPEAGDIPDDFKVGPILTTTQTSSYSGSSTVRHNSI